MVICLERDANDLHVVQLMSLHPLISCSSKIQNYLPFCCRLTQVVLEKGRKTDEVVLVVNMKVINVALIHCGILSVNL